MRTLAGGIRAVRDVAGIYAVAGMHAVRDVAGMHGENYGRYMYCELCQVCVQ